MSVASGFPAATDHLRVVFERSVARLMIKRPERRNALEVR